jgi:hypothetical protein
MSDFDSWIKDISSTGPKQEIKTFGEWHFYIKHVDTIPPFSHAQVIELTERFKKCFANLRSKGYEFPYEDSILNRVCLLEYDKGEEQGVRDMLADLVLSIGVLFKWYYDKILEAVK